MTVSDRSLIAPVSGEFSETCPEPQRIAVLQALNLGDLLCATPALRALRQRFPAAELVLIGNAHMAATATWLPSVDRFLAFPGWPGIAESPAAAGSRADWPAFDLAIQLHGSGSDSNGFVASLGAARTLGYGAPDDSRLTWMLPWVEREREPLRWLRLVAAIGVAEAGTQFDLPVSPIGRERLAQLLPPADGRPRVGLHVGARDPARRWPAAAFATVADVLIDRCDAHIILTGAIDERVLTADVRGRMRGDAVDRAGETTLDELAAVVASLDLLITNDTGVSHVAAATRTRSIVLFGPTRPERWAPLDQELHTAIDATQGVAEVNRAAALRVLPPETVIEAAWAALGLGAAARESSLESEWVACAG